MYFHANLRTMNFSLLKNQKIHLDCDFKNENFFIVDNNLSPLQQSTDDDDYFARRLSTYKRKYLNCTILYCPQNSTRLWFDWISKLVLFILKDRYRFVNEPAYITDAMRIANVDEFCDCLHVLVQCYGKFVQQLYAKNPNAAAQFNEMARQTMNGMGESDNSDTPLGINDYLTFMMKFEKIIDFDEIRVRLASNALASSVQVLELPPTIEGFYSIIPTLLELPHNDAQIDPICFYLYLVFFTSMTQNNIFEESIAQEQSSRIADESSGSAEQQLVDYAPFVVVDWSPYTANLDKPVANMLVDSFSTESSLATEMIVRSAFPDFLGPDHHILDYSHFVFTCIVQKVLSIFRRAFNFLDYDDVARQAALLIRPIHYSVLKDLPSRGSDISSTNSWYQHRRKRRRDEDNDVDTIYLQINLEKLLDLFARKHAALMKAGTFKQLFRGGEEAMHAAKIGITTPRLALPLDLVQLQENFELVCDYMKSARFHKLLQDDFHRPEFAHLREVFASFGIDTVQHMETIFNSTLDKFFPYYLYNIVGSSSSNSAASSEHFPRNLVRDNVVSQEQIFFVNLTASGHLNRQNVESFVLYLMACEEQFAVRPIFSMTDFKQFSVKLMELFAYLLSDLAAAESE